MADPKLLPYSKSQICSFPVGLIALSLLTQGCSTLGSKQVNAKLGRDAVITQLGEGSVSKLKGDSITISKKPVFIESPGHIGLLVIPVDSSTSSVDLDLRPMTDWGGPGLETRTNEVLNEVVGAVSEIQSLLAKSHGKEALEKLTHLQEKYSKITYLNFLKASCLVVSGEPEKAVPFLEIALKDFPDHSSGRKLYEQLTGKTGSKARKPATSSTSSKEAR